MQNWCLSHCVFRKKWLYVERKLREDGTGGAKPVNWKRRGRRPIASDSSSIFNRIQLIHLLKIFNPTYYIFLQQEINSIFFIFCCPSTTPSMFCPAWQIKEKVRVKFALVRCEVGWLVQKE